MDYKEYKQMVIDSEKGSLTSHSKTLHALMGMNGEAGECVDILKKHIFQGHELDVDHLLNELGDVCWYTMLLIVDLGINENHIFDYIDRLIHNRSEKYKSLDMGICYVLNLNTNCGQTTEIYFNSFADPGPNIYGNLRMVFYNIKMIANMYDKTLEDIFDINHEKVKKRYPDGFAPEKSMNRSDNL